MSKLEIFLVRYGIIITSVYWLLVVLNAWNGVNLYDENVLFGHTLILDSILCVLSHYKRYHCRYLSFLTYNLVSIDIIQYFDRKFDIFQEAELLLTIVSILYFITGIITIFLAIRHFILKKKRRSIEYKLK